MDTPQPPENSEQQKVLGPFTPQQFALLVVGGFIVYLAYRFAPLGVFLGVFLAVMIAVAVLMRQKRKTL